MSQLETHYVVKSTGHGRVRRNNSYRRLQRRNWTLGSEVSSFGVRREKGDTCTDVLEGKTSETEKPKSYQNIWERMHV